jgi:hypothetical protein
MQNPMRTHVLVIGWLNIILGILVLLVFSGVALFAYQIVVQVSSDLERGHNVAVLWGIFVVVALSFLLGIIAGFGLLQFAPWARILCIIVSFLHLLNASSLGVTTVLGIYSLIILLQPTTAELFQGRRP